MTKANGVALTRARPAKELARPLPARFRKANKLPETKKEATKSTREPDKVLTLLRNAIDDFGKKTTTIAAEAMISWQTVNRIVEGKTSRPQNYTCDRIFAACGKERILREKAA